MRASRFIAAAAGFLSLVLCSRAIHAATPQQIDKAILKAKAYLYAQQDKDGSWEFVSKPEPIEVDGQLQKKQSVRGGQWGGRTAITVYALLAAGEKPQDERLARAIAFLKKADMKGVYALGLRCQVWLLLPQTPDVKSLLRADAKELIAMAKPQTSAMYARGMYDYVKNDQTPEYSHSRSQYAALGVWAAQQTGVEIPSSYWKLIEESWTRNQEPSGGWSYTHGSRRYSESPGMTAAGVATLYEAQDGLSGSRGLNCQGNFDSPAIAKGLKWLGDNADKIGTTTRYERDFPYATLYAFERVGVAAGYKYIGKVDWFDRGANWLIATQRSDGSWSAKPTDGASADRWFPGTVDASFGVLFLARGRSPLVMSKLQYRIAPPKGSGEAKEAHWNERPRDAANLVRSISRSIERNLNWQVVNLQSGSADDLNDAPILYIAGNELLNFTPDEQARLRRFVEQGGLILGNADCASREFSGSFRKLGTTLFPSYEFRRLPADHPIYRGGPFDAAKWKSQPGYLGLSNGVREFMVLAPDTDPAKSWLTNQKPELIQAAANLYFYSTARRGLDRGQTHLVKADPAIKTQQTLKLARVQYPGNWDPEPGGWRRLAAVMHNQRKIDLQVEPVKLGDGKLASYKLADLTGTGSVKVNDAGQKELKEFVATGGTLIVDAAGGSTAGAAELEKLLSTVFPEPLKTLAPKHPLFTAGGGSTTPIRYREFARRIVGTSNAPRLKGIEIKGRVAVVFSADDLSCGLVGHNIDGISGYEPATATDLMSRIILYASGPPSSAPSSAPTSKPSDADGL